MQVGLGGQVLALGLDYANPLLNHGGALQQGVSERSPPMAGARMLAHPTCELIVPQRSDTLEYVVNSPKRTPRTLKAS